ncbi:MAG: RNA polymerase factor sigma-54 [Bacteroidota bacterium]|nr:RNA polymerase factor sigma-54 [Bacteroidota bacterium]
MLKTSLQQRLQQRLSPQQIQYIKLLQLPTLAFEQRVAAELEQNPALEEGPEEEQELLLTEEEAQAFEVAETFVPEPEEPESETSLEVSVAPVSSPEPSIPAALGDPQTPAADGSRSEDEYSWEELLAGQDLDPERYYQTRGGEDPDEEDDPWARTPARETFIERLQAQLLYLDLDERGRLIAEQIIGSLDPDGYLRRPLSSIVDDLLFSHGVEVSEAEVETVLKQIQRLDPVGVGARSLKECLEVQLEALPESTPARELALRIVREAFGELSRKHFDAILRKFEIPREALLQAWQLLQRLNPKPGDGDGTPELNYITPDFEVYEQEGEFVVTLNRRNVPELRISRQYRQMWEELQQPGRRQDPNLEEAREYLKKKIEDARWFINSIRQRHNTMLKVMRAIVELQEDFFRHGEGHLKPMILKDVAERIGMDISTVSRVVSGKYVQTEFGTFPLKYFFSEGLETESGEEISNREVKNLIKELIEQEDKRNPLSDDKIAEILVKRGLKIARRTVTKYREQLGIPVARLRREL